MNLEKELVRGTNDCQSSVQFDCAKCGTVALQGWTGDIKSCPCGATRVGFPSRDSFRSESPMAPDTNLFFVIILGLVFVGVIASIFFSASSFRR